MWLLFLALARAETPDADMAQSLRAMLEARGAHDPPSWMIEVYARHFSRAEADEIASLYAARERAPNDPAVITAFANSPAIQKLLEPTLMAELVEAADRAPPYVPPPRPAYVDARPPATTVEPALDRDIRALLLASGWVDLWTSEHGKRFARTMTDRAVKIYAAYYTPDDVRVMIAFAATPGGAALGRLPPMPTTPEAYQAEKAFRESVAGQHWLAAHVSVLSDVLMAESELARAK